MKINFRKVSAKGDKKGLVLVAVLWIVVVLTVISSVLARKSQLDSKVCLARLEGLMCKWAGRAGIETAVALLNEDERETDCLYDIWSDVPEDLNDVSFERCWFSVRVIDESGKLNVNTATRDQLLALPYMTEDIADAIIDWRDSDEEPGEVGVEGGYYENLLYPYLNRNAPFRTIRELLLVRGVTEELFYGEDTNLNGRLDYNEMDGNANPPADNGDGLLDQGIAAYLTCYTSSSTGQTTQGAGQTQTTSDGLVNVNTASDIVLAALMGGTDDAYRAADAIISYRSNFLYGIEDPSELTSEAIVSSDLFSMMQDYLTVTSNIFTIRCVATADRGGLSGATLQTEAVVDRSTSPYNILYWYQGASN